MLRIVCIVILCNLIAVAVSTGVRVISSRVNVNNMRNSAAPINMFRGPLKIPQLHGLLGPHGGIASSSRQLMGSSSMSVPGMFKRFELGFTGHDNRFKTSTGAIFGKTIVVPSKDKHDSKTHPMIAASEFKFPHSFYGILGSSGGVPHHFDFHTLKHPYYKG